MTAAAPRRSFSPMTYERIAAALAPHGLMARGGFQPDPAENLGATVVLVGNAGSALWPVFAAARRAEDEPHPLDAWTRRVVTALAETLGAEARFPFDGPPHAPFQQWAQRAESVFPSPLGMLIHPRHGLWHAYRAALVFAVRMDSPPRTESASPCAACGEKPCLNACPAGAFSPDGYDLPACVGHLKSTAGAPCMSFGCAARRACPIGRAYIYDPPLAAFHMERFRARFA